MHKAYIINETKYFSMYTVYYNKLVIYIKLMLLFCNINITMNDFNFKNKNNQLLFLNCTEIYTAELYTELNQS